MTVFARNPDTGMAKWVYQMTPHDEWDFDGVNEMILADKPFKGQEIASCRAFRSQWLRLHVYRDTGELLVAEKYDPAVNWAHLTSICRPARPRGGGSNTPPINRAKT